VIDRGDLIIAQCPAIGGIPSGAGDRRVSDQAVDMPAAACATPHRNDECLVSHPVKILWDVGFADGQIGFVKLPRGW
jgi:hypothetical protein